jgi:hypothetical protein
LSEGTAYQSGSVVIAEEAWRHLSTASVYLEHDIVEPNEVIQEDQLFELTEAAFDAFLVEARIISDGEEFYTKRVALKEFHDGSQSKAERERKVANRAEEVGAGEHDSHTTVGAGEV